MAEDETRLSYEQLLAENQHLRQENANLTRQLTFDDLTGLYRDTDQGRKIALEEIRQARQELRDIVMAKFDLRRLKLINDQYDHETGDQALIAFVGELRKIVGDNGIGMRSHFRGDEFAALFFGVDQGTVERKLRGFQKTGVNWATEKATGNISFTLGVVGLEEIEGKEKMTDGELFQNLWQTASGKEREEHRRLSG